jgi:zinc/manganese transport system substrate-binding protein
MIAARYRSFRIVALCTLVALVAGCTTGNDDASGSLDDPAAVPVAPDTTLTPVTDLPDVVVTYSVLGAFVDRLLEGVADVVVLIPDGQDPHDFEPSPRDVELLNNADLVVANGLDLEEGLDDALVAARESGVPVFYVTEHVTVLDVLDVNDHSSHGHDHAGAQTDHSHGDHEHSEDPHVWLSPATMLEALPALALVAGDSLGVDLSVTAEAFANELAAVDAELTTLFDGLSGCQLVTGHNELGYLAARYGCTVIAAIISSPSTTAEESAGNIEFVIDVIKTHYASTIFYSLGTNPAVAQRVAEAAGVQLVEINTHYLGTTSGYVEFIRALGSTIASSLR